MLTDPIPAKLQLQMRIENKICDCFKRIQVYPMSKYLESHHLHGISIFSPLSSSFISWYPERKVSRKKNVSSTVKVWTVKRLTFKLDSAPRFDSRRNYFFPTFRPGIKGESKEEVAFCRKKPKVSLKIDWNERIPTAIYNGRNFQNESHYGILTMLIKNSSAFHCGYFQPLGIMELKMTRFSSSLFIFIFMEIEWG